MNSKFLCPSCKAILKFDIEDIEKVNKVKCPKCAYQGSIGDFKEIVLKKVYCPSCNAALKMTDTSSKQQVACPECKNSTAAANYLTTPKKESDDETEIKGKGNKKRHSIDEDVTEKQQKDKLYKPGKLVFVESDARWLENTKEFVLLRGVNTLGRKNQSSTATIQFPTEDSYMSRKHATIEVIMREDAVFVHRLSNCGSKNGTFHNGDRVEDGDIINIMPNDTIKLGHTKFRLETN